MKTISVALYVFFAFTFSIVAGVIITPVIPEHLDNSLHADTINAILPVATISAYDRDKSFLINGIGFKYDGNYLTQVHVALDLCIIEEGKILWTGRADIRSDPHDYFNLNIFVPKGKEKKLTLACIRRGFAQVPAALILNFTLYHSPGNPGFTRSFSPYIVVATDDQLELAARPLYEGSVAAIRREQALGTFVLQTVTGVGNEAHVVLTDPVFRLYVSGARASNLLRLKLCDRTGKVLLRDGKVVPRGAQAMIQFKGQIKVPKGESQLVVQGLPGTTYQLGASLGIALVPSDQGIVKTASGIAFAIHDGRSVPSQELVFGTPPVPRK